MNTISITNQYVLNVLKSSERNVPKDKITDFADMLDVDAILEAASLYDDEGAQENAIHEEIRSQLNEELQKYPKIV